MPSSMTETYDAQRTRLLVVDDDKKLCRLIKDYLEPLGYDVSAAHTGKDGLEKALAETFDAVILDIMMPEMDGLEVLRRLRAASSVPVLMLTGLGDESDRIVGLEMGADDYLPKTFSTRELLARLRAVIRRSRVTAAKGTPTGKEQHEQAITVGNLRMEQDTRVATLDDKPLSLTAVEFDLLLALARVPGRVKSREQLLLEVAERDFEAFDRSIDVHISSIRRKLGDDAKSPRWVQTVRSVGYRLLKPGMEIDS
jgi:two-component system, OmpR family, response regulator CpxR